MSELTDFAIIVLVVAGAFSLSILATQLGNHLPVPAPAVFLVAAAVASDVWPVLREDVSVRTVERVAVIALIVVLLNGGMDTGWRRFRAAAGPIMAIGIAGTFITAAVLTGAAHWLLGMDWKLAGVVGAALAPTDPAVVFSVLGGREIGGRSGTTLEGEAGVNDPAGIALMIGVIELATHDDATFLVIVQDFAVEMAIGLVFGLAAARVVPALRHVRLPSEALYPVFVAVLAAVLYSVTSLAGGSGFLAVFVAGLFLGDASIPYKTEIERFQGSLAGLAEIVVFIALGLTIDITHLPAPDVAARRGARARPRRRRAPARGGAHPHRLVAVARRAGVHRLERPEGRRADPAGRLRHPRRRRRRRQRLRPGLRRRPALRARAGHPRPVGRPSARDPHAQPGPAPVAALGRPQRETPRRARVLRDRRRDRRRTNHRRPAPATRRLGQPHRP